MIRTSTTRSPLVSIYGKTLLKELHEPSTANLEVITDIILKDPLAGRLKDSETGENSFHLLLGKIILYYTPPKYNNFLYYRKRISQKVHINNFRTIN